jgi:hypothetical protein
LNMKGEPKSQYGSFGDKNIFWPRLDLNSGLSSIKPSYCTDYTIPAPYASLLHLEHIEYVCADGPHNAVLKGKR